MKKSKILNAVFLSFIFWAIAISCNKEEIKKIESNDILTETRSIGNGKHINCIGKCGEEECYSVINPNTFISTCAPCSECKLKIVYDSEQGASEIYRTDLSKVNKFFLKSLKKDFPDDWKMYKIKETYFDKNRNTEFIKITFEINGIIFSKSFFNEFNKNGRSTGPIIEVDCTGSCGPKKTNQICTESYDINAGTVKCACESDLCKMKVVVVSE